MTIALKCIQHTIKKFVFSERFIRTLNTKLYNQMTSILKNVYINKLDETVDKLNNTYHKTIKKKLGDVKVDTYID